MLERSLEKEIAEALEIATKNQSGTTVEEVVRNTFKLIKNLRNLIDNRPNSALTGDKEFSIKQDAVIQFTTKAAQRINNKIRFQKRNQERSSQDNDSEPQVVCKDIKNHDQQSFSVEFYNQAEKKSLGTLLITFKTQGEIQRNSAKNVLPPQSNMHRRVSFQPEESISLKFSNSELKHLLLAQKDITEEYLKIITAEEALRCTLSKKKFESLKNKKEENLKRKERLVVLIGKGLEFFVTHNDPTVYASVPQHYAEAFDAMRELLNNQNSSECIEKLMNIAREVEGHRKTYEAQTTLLFLTLLFMLSAFPLGFISESAMNVALVASVISILGTVLLTGVLQPGQSCYLHLGPPAHHAAVLENIVKIARELKDTSQSQQFAAPLSQPVPTNTAYPSTQTIRSNTNSGTNVQPQGIPHLKST